MISYDDGLLSTSNGFNGSFPSTMLYCGWLKLMIAATHEVKEQLNTENQVNNNII